MQSHIPAPDYSIFVGKTITAISQNNGWLKIEFGKSMLSCRLMDEKTLDMLSRLKEVLEK